MSLLLNKKKFGKISVVRRVEAWNLQEGKKSHLFEPEEVPPEEGGEERGLNRGDLSLKKKNR